LAARVGQPRDGRRHELWATAVLGTLTAALPRRWRPAWIGWLLAAGVGVVAVGRDFTDVGHAVALALGMLVSTRVGRPHHWTPVRS